MSVNRFIYSTDFYFSASKHQVKTKWLQIDFSDDEHIYDEIKNFLEVYDVGVLVNNVGISQPIAEFLTIPNLSKTIRNIVRVNITSTFKVNTKKF